MRAARLTGQVAIVLLICAVPRDAHAYVDPGSGLLLLQGLLALIGGIIIFVRNPIETTRRLWRRIFKKNPPPES